ncbi:MAG: uroporphyrinogen-III synthase [Planctomycetaceae bacterium]
MRFPHAPADRPNTPLRVCSFESRRADEMAALIRKHGGQPTVAPSMQEITLDDNQQIFTFAGELLKGRIDAVIFLTGVGATKLREVAELRHPREELTAALDRCTIIVRGPKPTAVLTNWGVHIDHRAPEPNTWRELLAMLDQADVDLRGKSVAVQEYGQPNNELVAALCERGADVRPVPVYCWKLPDDIGPLEAAVRTTCARGFDVLLFTSAQQVRHVIEVAARLYLEPEWIAAASETFIGSIGPTCSETIHEAGLAVDREPTHPKMGVLVREALAAAYEQLPIKRRSLPSP